MTFGRDPSSQIGMGLDPTALEEPGRDHLAPGEGVEDALGHAGSVGTIGMLRIEGQREPKAGAREPRDHLRAARYFSTPLITMPRVKKRWNTRKITIGMIIVIRVPAWMNA
jgi:hypothetical protein